MYNQSDIMKVSLITTIYNEEKTIIKLLNSINSQTVLPNEVIIVDAGSKDETISKINDFSLNFKNKLNIILIVKKGNRSSGRNAGIKKAKSEIILCTDAGCILDKKWIETISEPFRKRGVDVVAGYYKPVANSIFQKCLSTYTCIMPDKINERDFLPSSRSIAFKKSSWKKVGGYPQWLDTCEDLYFARELKRKGCRFQFQKNAIVYWKQKKDLGQALIQFFNYAIGDGRAFFIRPQVYFIFLRYFLGMYFIFLILLERFWKGFILIPGLLFLYVIWAINKNYKYIREKRALLILPILQFTSDLAVLLGTTIGLLKKIYVYDFSTNLKKNKFLFFILFVYISIMLLTLNYGIPNQHHPFPYNMDEWHQLQAVRATFAYGTPNVLGAANGTMFHFILSGLYLVPFTLLHLINPFKLNVDALMMRENIFILLRINTIIWGVLSIFVVYKIADIIKAPKKITLFLFTFTPIWLSYSGFFKYDIALVFWLLLALFFIAKFYKNPTNFNYIIAAIPAGLTLAVKISALPILPIYLLAYFWFIPNWKKSFKYLLTGTGFFVITVLLFGFPDTLFGKGNIYKYFYENVIAAPGSTDNFNLGMNAYLYLYSHHYPLIFGHGLMLIFVVACIFWIYFLTKKGLRNSVNKYRMELFIFLALGIFVFSLLPLRLGGGGNRALVLLPFFVLIISLGWKNMIRMSILKVFLSSLLVLVVIDQLYVSALWVNMRKVKSPQEISSEWIIKNISKKTVIGLENVPIYQNVPDNIQKEFYYEQYNIKNKNRYKYIIIDKNSLKLPNIIIITNGKITSEFLYESPKEDLLKRLMKENYKEYKVFRQNYGFFGVKDLDYFSSGLMASPVTTSIYIKQER